MKPIEMEVFLKFILDFVENDLSFNFRRLCLFAGLSSAILLQGCGAPGFNFLSAGTALNGGDRQHIVGYRPVVENAPTDIDAPEGSITPISAALIRAQTLAAPVSVPVEIRALFGAAAPYTIGPGDVIGVIVYDHPELLPNAGAVISQQADPTGVSVAPGFIVGSNGEISFPYVGRVRIQGLTETEASELIAQKISKYIRDPQVTTRIQAFRSRRAYVEGEVRTPGLQIFTDVPMTLAEALNRAGGILPTGDRSFVTLTRAGLTTRIDLQTLQDLGSDATKILLMPGDSVFVHNREDSKIYVMGEILRPSALLMKNGRLSLNEALGESGGPNLLTSNPSQIYVIRNKADGNPEIFHLDAKNPASLALADRFPLRPKDVVYVDPVPLVLWSRIVSLILPSAQVVYFGSQAATK